MSTSRDRRAGRLHEAEEEIRCRQLELAEKQLACTQAQVGAAKTEERLGRQRHGREGQSAGHSGNPGAWPSNGYSPSCRAE